MLLFFGLFSLLVSVIGMLKATRRGQAFQTTPYLLWMGIFVWADAVILGPFWVLATLVSIYFGNWILFCLIISIFWVVRASGETIYWIQEQFASKHRNVPESLVGESLFHGELIWVMYQLMWQCITVVAVLASLYFGRLLLL